MRLPQDVQAAINAKCLEYLDRHAGEWITISTVGNEVGPSMQAVASALRRLADSGVCRLQIREYIGKASRIRQQRLYSGHPVETGRGLAVLFGMVAVHPVGGRIVRGRSFVDDDALDRPRIGRPRKFPDLPAR